MKERKFFSRNSPLDKIHSKDWDTFIKIDIWDMKNSRKCTCFGRNSICRCNWSIYHEVNIFSEQLIHRKDAHSACNIAKYVFTIRCTNLSINTDVIYYWQKFAKGKVREKMRGSYYHTFHTYSIKLGVCEDYLEARINSSDKRARENI